MSVFMTGETVLEDQKCFYAINTFISPVNLEILGTLVMPSFSSPGG